jgi:CheY-like chemotaxis protein
MQHADTMNPKPKILIVDDNADFAEVLAVLLTQHGHPATVAEGAEEALDKLDEDATIGVIITDLRMPGVDGMDFRRVVRYRFPKMPVLLMTGMPLDEDDLPPADAVLLQKPFSFQAVIAALARVT